MNCVMAYKMEAIIVLKMALNDAQIHWHIENVGGVFEIQLISQLLITNNLGLPITVTVNINFDSQYLLVHFSDKC